MPSSNILEERLGRLLQQIYPDQDQGLLTAQVIAAFWPDPKKPLQEPQQSGNAQWSQKDSLLITYGDSVIDGKSRPLQLLHSFLHDRLSDVVNGVHILPFFPYTSDDGFAVSDYYKVNSELGSWDDISAIAKDFQLMSDLVLNHVSSQSAWFSAYLQDEPPYDEYFIEASPDEDLTATVRPRTSPLLQAVETPGGTRHVWCTFSHDQIDLNFKSHKLLLEIIRIIRLHVDQGVRIIRLDAVAFLWKEPGTSSVHLPQTHAVVKLLRVLADFAQEQIVLLTETNVPKAENLSYFGQGDEAHMIYNFPLPPLILHALLAGTATYLNRWQAAMPPAPMGCSYLNFSASHDGIGMRPAEGLLPAAEVAQMITTITEQGGKISMRKLPDGSETVYELNCTYFDALAQPFEGGEEHHIERFLTSQTVVMSLEGIPAFYIHALLATPNDQQGVLERDMPRAINRHSWDYTALQQKLIDAASNQSTVLDALSTRIRLRSEQPAFHPNATQFTLRVDDRVFGIWRQSLDRTQSIFALHNMSCDEIVIELSTLNLIADEQWLDLLAGETIDELQESLVFAPYQCRWITNRV